MTLVVSLHLLDHIAVLKVLKFIHCNYQQDNCQHQSYQPVVDFTHKSHHLAFEFQHPSHQLAELRAL